MRELRILPLGDSITGSSCYRALLWQKLNENGHTEFDFVGSQTNDSGCSPASYDRDSEGHGGYLVTDLAGSKYSELEAWCSANPADVVLMHFGTNDVWSSKPVQTILDAYSVVVDELRKNNPEVVVLVAQIIPMNPINTASCSTCACPGCGGRVQALNAEIPGWASSKSTSASPVIVVDQWTGFNANAGQDTGDGVHPNASGSAKMANKWYDALVPHF
ncbi:SGNH/GDSL hydrolase family protein [Sorangium cellulosum]|nr:SGNH/GDSL hydrolase family protein [Sorangium cellulosum]